MESAKQQPAHTVNFQKQFWSEYVWAFIGIRGWIVERFDWSASDDPLYAESANYKFKCG